MSTLDCDFILDKTVDYMIVINTKVILYLRYLWFNERNDLSIQLCIVKVHTQNLNLKQHSFLFDIFVKQKAARQAQGFACSRYINSEEALLCNITN